MAASTFLPVPYELNNKCLKVHHIDGNNSNCNLENLLWEEDIEIWKEIEYGDIKPHSYMISNHGRIKTLINNKNSIMKISKEKYNRICLYCIKGKKHFSIHRLVANAFIQGFNEDKNQVNHIDGNHFNNHWSNLEWVSGSENIIHGYLTKLIKNPNLKINDEDVIKICLSLNKYNGNVMKVYNELKHTIENLTYAIVSSIKYEMVHKNVANMYLKNNGKEKLVRHTDEEIIYDVSICLKQNKGDVKKTKQQMTEKYPWITYGWIWHIKDKSVGSEISDKVFRKDEFPKVIPLTESDALLIIKTLLEYQNEKYANQLVFDKLKEVIPGLSKDKIRSIKEKKAWKELSDKYFSREDFK